MSKYFFYGNDVDGIKDKINKILLNNTDLNIEGESVKEIKIEDPQEIKNISNINLSLFLNHTLLKVYLTKKVFKELEQSANESSKALDRFDLYKGVFIVLVLENAEKTLQTEILKSEFLRILKNKKYVIEPCNLLKYWQTREILHKVNESAHSYGIQFEKEALDLFVEYIKHDINNLKNELQKIHTFIYPQKTVSEKDVKDLYIGLGSIDDLYESLLRKDLFSTSLKFKFVNASNFASPLYIFAVLQAKFRELLQVKTFCELNYNLQKLPFTLNQYKIKKLTDESRKITSAHLKKIISRLSETEHKLKSGLLNEKNALEMFLVQI